MKNKLQPGLAYEHVFVVQASKTVPFLYPEAEEFQDMPKVFATGYLVGFIEWTCMKAIQPYLEQESEQSVGTHINISHLAPTPAGFEITAKVSLAEREGKRLFFEIEVHDGIDVIAKGSHERFIINRQSFDKKVAEKQSLAKNQS
jgi:fluoroacetyl-CoA thioesterase